MLRGMGLFGCAAMLAMGAGAQAQDDAQSVEFSVGQSNFAMPVPAGYCVPEGTRARAAAYFATLDQMNHTPAKVEFCDDPDNRYTLVKALISTSQMTFKREPFLDEFDAAVQTIDFGSIVDVANDGIEDRTQSDGLPKLSVSTTDKPFGYIGRDDMCVYLGGVMQIAVAGETKRANAAACATVIAGKHMAINVYDFRPEKQSVDELTALARRTAEAISARP